VGDNLNRTPRRSKLQIYGDLLHIIEAEYKNGKIVLTRIQTKINVPFDRLKKYLSELKSLALIEDEKTLKVTEKGKRYMKEYGHVMDFMDRMGVTCT
jgi:predicted transcriptional regulator